MDGWRRMLWTIGLVFCTTFIVQVLASGIDVFNLDMATLQAALNSAIAAVLALLVNMAAPWIKQYGYNAEPKQ